MKKIIKLKESDITKIVKRILMEGKQGKEEKIPEPTCGASSANCNETSCILNVDIVPVSPYSDGTPRVRMDYEICGTGVLTLHRNGDFKFSHDTCDTSFNTVNSFHVAVFPPSNVNDFVSLVKFVVVLTCDSGEVITKHICFDGHTMDRISCKKKLPMSPTANTTTKG